MYDGTGERQLTPLSKTEKAFVEFVYAAHAHAFDAGKQDDLVIRADLIRAMIMGRPLNFDSTHFDGRSLPPSGIRLCNAKVTGPLDLTGARSADGGPAVPLELVDCKFDSEVTLARSHFRYLSFHRSSLPCLWAPQVFVEGPLNLGNITSTHARGTYLFLAGLRTEGDLFLNRARIANLTLRDAKIGGRLCLDRMNIEVTTQQDRLDKPFANGPLKMWSRVNICGAVIAGDLECRRSHIKITGDFRQDIPAIMAEHAIVEGDVFIQDLDVETDHPRQFAASSLPGATLNFNGFAVRGFFNLSGSQIDATFLAAGLMAGGNVSIAHTEITRDIFMVNAEIGGNLSLSSSSVLGNLNTYLANVNGDFEIEESSLNFVSLDSATTSGALVLQNLYATQVSLRGARIKNKLVIAGCVVSRPRGAEPDIYRVSPESKAIEFDNDTYFDVKRQFVYQHANRYYYDQKNKFFSDLSNIGEKSKTFAIREKPGGQLEIGYLTINAFLNDYRFHKSRDGVASIMPWLKAVLGKEDQAEAFYRYCIDKSIDMPAPAPVKTEDTSAKPFGEYMLAHVNETFLPTFATFILTRMKEVLHINLVKTFPNWKAVTKADSTDEPEWNMYGVEAHELDDDDGRGYGHGYIELDEFKYDQITPSKRAPEPIVFPGGSYFKVARPVEWYFTYLEWQRRFWSTVQYGLRETKVDLVVTVLYIGLLTAGLAILMLTPMSPLWARDTIRFFYQNILAISLVAIGLGAIGWLIGFDVTHSPSSIRKGWLKRQFRSSRLSRKQSFRPFPYEFLAKYLRARGYDHDSRRVLSQRLTEERRLKTAFFLRPLSILFQLGFEYGLSPGRAVTTFTLCMVIGFIGCLQLQRGYVVDPYFLSLVHSSAAQPSCSQIHPTADCNAALVVTTNTVNAAALVSSEDIEKLADGKRYRPAMPIIDPTLPAATMGDIEIPCGKKIQASLYAIDSFIPAVDLGQESQCEVSGEPRFLAWRWAKAIYSLLGWLVTSLVILTVSGILRRQIEG